MGGQRPYPVRCSRVDCITKALDLERPQVLGSETRVHICLPKLRIPVLPVFLSIGLPVVSAVGLIDTGSKEGEQNCSRSMQVGMRPTRMDL